MDKSLWQPIVGTVSAFIGAAGFFLAWRHHREVSLRREDVLNWSNQVIESLQTLYFLCTLSTRDFAIHEGNRRISEIAIKTTVLVEQGRLFFRNQKVDDWGSEKKPAYQGYRPKILDPVVTAHQIAVRWLEKRKSNKDAICEVAHDCIQDFVSLAQLEVGRSKTVSAETGRGGDGASLERALVKKRR